MLNLNEIEIGKENFEFLNNISQDDYIKFEHEYRAQLALLDGVVRKYNDKVSNQLSDQKQRDEISAFITKIQNSPVIFTLIEFALLLYACKLLDLSFFRYIEPLLTSDYIPKNKGTLVDVIKFKFKQEDRLKSNGY